MKLGNDVTGEKERNDEKKIVIYEYFESQSGRGKNEHRFSPSRLPITSHTYECLHRLPPVPACILAIVRLSLSPRCRSLTGVYTG
jgi:hypothetical protein